MCACALAGALLTGAWFVAQSAPARATTAQSVSIEIAQAAPAVYPDDTFRATVTATLSAPAEYFEVRVQVLSRSGYLMYQKTEVRADLPAGRHAVDYEYDLSRLGLSPGRYPVEVRVLATGSAPTYLSSRLLVLDPEAPPVQLAVVVGLDGTPWFGPDGRVTHDPATEAGVRDSLAFITQVALAHKEPISLAIAPVLLEEIARVSAGYETTAGVVVPADSEVSRRYAETIAALRSAVASGTLTLTDVPYALPDLPGLGSIGADSDVVTQLARGDAALAAALQSGATTATAYVGDYLAPEALSGLAARGTRAVVAPPPAVRVQESAAPPGSYLVEGSGLTLLITDDAIASGVHYGADAFYDALFDHVGQPGCTVVMLKTGPGAENSVIDVQHVLDLTAAAPTWLRLIDVNAAPAAQGDAELTPLPEPDAPQGHWARIGEARVAQQAYLSAAGPEDGEAVAVNDAVMRAESGLWAGPDRDWAGAPEAQAFADSVLAFTGEEFGKISVDAKDVTLSGRSGDVPLTLMNGTGKPLQLTLVLSADVLRIPESRIPVTAQPDETFLTVPVHLDSAVADDLRVAVLAGDMTIAETTVRIAGSYLDRLATVGTVVLVLLLLLLFIHRRVRRANAATISNAAEDGPDRT